MHFLFTWRTHSSPHMQEELSEIGHFFMLSPIHPTIVFNLLSERQFEQVSLLAQTVVAGFSLPFFRVLQRLVAGLVDIDICYKTIFLDFNFCWTGCIYIQNMICGGYTSPVVRNLHIVHPVKVIFVYYKSLQLILRQQELRWWIGLWNESNIFQWVNRDT